MADKPITPTLQAPGRFTHSSWASELLLSSIIEHLPVAIFAKDVQADYRISLWNRAAETLFGLHPEQMIGFTDYDLFTRDKADYFRLTDERVMQGGTVIDIPEEEIVSPRGTWFAHTVKVPIYDETGRPAILLGIIEDISDRKAAIEHHAARVEAEKTARAKSEFLAHMSHELRTPLNSILGLAGILLGTGLSEKQRKMVATLDQASHLLMKTVNDVLDLSKIEAGQVELESIPFDALATFRQSVELLRTQADEKQLALYFAAPEIAPPMLQGDPSRLSRILNNLIGNAIKYTPKGNVTLHMQWREQEGHIEIAGEVADTGIGIPPEKHEHIFSQFAQADASITRRYGGTGLGLSITRQLVTLMGGAIGVESEAGKGARFWFTLPFAHAAARPSAPASVPRASALPMAAAARILLAEDNPMNQVFMTTLLETRGFPAPDIAADGGQALAYAERTPYDIILMDCQMPILSGYDATRAIRALKDSANARVPIVALTANAMQGEREICLAAGMDDYIAKPIDIPVFEEIMGRYFTLGKPAAAPAADTAQAPVDLAFIRQFSGGDADHERHLATIFIRQSEHVRGALHNACIDGPSPAWCEAAHFLKGSAGSLGAKTLYGLCTQAQQQADATAEQRRALLIPIEAEMRAIHDFFTEQGLLAA